MNQLMQYVVLDVIVVAVMLAVMVVRARREHHGVAPDLQDEHGNLSLVKLENNDRR